ncbi:MAG: hypothetical protein CMJ32_06580 [Phycisphaerae bacterium]|nr:hypothetical protein [Phycisphaerae bacterium]
MSPLIRLIHADSTNCTSRLPVLFMGGLLLLLAGCSTPRPATIQIDSAQYQDAFNAALEATRRLGMPPLVRDRQGGLIETRPRVAGSLADPWRIDQASLGQAMNNTLKFQRRRVRIEFLPSDFMPENVTDKGPLSGPAVPGSEQDRLVDRQLYEGTLELRVWVITERAFRPGQRFNAWTRLGNSYTRDPVQADAISDDPSRDRSNWTPIARDPAYEQRIISRITSLMEQDSAD